MSIFHLLAVCSGMSFLLYGVSCLTGESMVQEFERFGLAKYRTLTGLLEVCGGAGLLIGLWSPPLFIAAATGLTVLMLLGVGVRLRMRDGVLLTLPAFVLFVVNGYLAIEAWRRLSHLL